MQPQNGRYTYYHPLILEANANYWLAMSGDDSKKAARPLVEDLAAGWCTDEKYFRRITESTIPGVTSVSLTAPSIF